MTFRVTGRHQTYAPTVTLARVLELRSQDNKEFATTTRGIVFELDRKP
jgi:hypothetical protein